jgi:collagenase-like PrtC family protease
MRLSVATNFDPRLLEGLERYPVSEVFGKLPRDFVGGGRASYMLTPLSRGSLAAHVAEAHRRGIQFNYLLNAACLSNLEWTRRGQREIERLLAWLARIGVDAVTVSLPHLLELIKRRYPRFRVQVGVFAGVDSVQKAKWWEDLGADGITLASLAVNRNFSLLAAIRRSVACELQLLVNTNCLYACPLASAHMVALSHASQAGHAAGGFLIDYYLLKCTQMKLREPVNYIRSDWIRPEDLHHYQALGYEQFKIAERNAPTEVMVRRVKAYSEGRYEGNLLDLVQGYGFACGGDPPRYHRRGLYWNFWTFLRPFLVNPIRLLGIRRLAKMQGMLSPLTGKPPVVIDNRALDGFINFFFSVDCRDRDCEACRYCYAVAEKAVRIMPGFRGESLERFGRVLEDLAGGGMWGFWSPPYRGSGTPRGPGEAV